MIRMLMLAALISLAVACGGGDGGDDGNSDADDGSERADAAAAVQAADDEEESTAADADAQADAEGTVGELREDLEELQEARGGGAATLTVGDQTWEFVSVLCAFGEEQIGQEGAEFVLSSLQDGLQLYASIDQFGHSVSLHDIVDFEDPSVALSADRGTLGLIGSAGPEDFVQLDGKAVRAETEFRDETAEGFEGIPGMLEATCP